jgi:hypothetical protein
MSDDPWAIVPSPKMCKTCKRLDRQGLRWLLWLHLLPKRIGQWWDFR